MVCDTPVEVPHFEHDKDVKIKVPGTLEMLPPDVKPERVCTAFFDGGSAGHVGTAGYVCYAPSGKLWFGAGVKLPTTQHTNNAAELAACTHLLLELQRRGELPESAEGVVMHGDSQLIISYLNRKAKASAYFLEVQKVREILKGLGY